MATEHVSNQNVTVETVDPTDFQSRILTIDFLFLDRHSCERCADTEDALHAALDRVDELLADVGVGIHLRKTRVDTEDDAYRTGLQISPTIRLDGRDIQPNFGATECDSCTDIAGCCDDEDEDEAAIDCRSWVYRGHTFDVPPVELLIEAILSRAVGGTNRSRGSPGSVDAATENLQQFFNGNSGSESGSTDGEESSEDSGSCCC